MNEQLTEKEIMMDNIHMKKFSPTVKKCNLRKEQLGIPWLSNGQDLLWPDFYPCWELRAHMQRGVTKENKMKEMDCTTSSVRGSVHLYKLSKTVW